LDAAVGAILLGPDEAVLDEMKPAFTNEANKVSKFVGIAAGSVARAVATEGG
jgi:hypothetical protein